MGDSVIGLLKIDPAHAQSPESLEAGISDYHFVNCQTVHAASGPFLRARCSFGSRPLASTWATRLSVNTAVANLYWAFRLGMGQ